MRRWILSGVLAVALVITGTWGYNQYTLNRDYAVHMENIYQKSYYELVGNLGNIESRLAKIMVSEDQGQHMILLSEVARQADIAQLGLGQLPVSHLALINTQKFLNQMADYSYYLAKNASDGKPVTVEEMENLQSLYDNCVILNNELRDMTENMERDGIRWGEIRSRGNEHFGEASDDLVSQQLINIERTSIDYPALIYDGPFSEALNQGQRLNVSGKTITQEEAEGIAAAFIGKDRIEEVTNSSQSTGDIETWGVHAVLKNEESPVFMQITKQGGKVVTMITNHGKKETNVSIDEVVKDAHEFLESRGYPGMEPTYRQHYDGVAVINFAYVENDIIMYPDLIKVKICMENGEIMGFEAKNYLIAHKDRDLEEPELSMEEARKLVSSRLDIKSERMAVIPTETREERLCYEFKGEYNGETFLVYIDANTGEEADILQIIDTDNGTMAI